MEEKKQDKYDGGDVSLDDLVQSIFKRSINIKDSGNILPGHGGILDRFDAILLVSPMVFIFLQIIQEFL